MTEISNTATNTANAEDATISVEATNIKEMVKDHKGRLVGNLLGHGHLITGLKKNQEIFERKNRNIRRERLHPHHQTGR